MAISRVRVLTSLFSRALHRPIPSPTIHQYRSVESARSVRWCATASEQNKELDDINSKFAEAREEIELALESKETVYFNEEAETARVAVQVVLDKYEALLGKLNPKEKGAVQRSMGLKMEQLKAELAQLKE